MVIEIKEVFKMKKKWGFLRETDAMAKKAGIDKDTGVHRTGLGKLSENNFSKNRRLDTR